uniref:Secreted protein n=1 Tax=Steinernema glaseri TaxID=37863 RepID=A0A1I8A0M5_9BILA
MQGILGAVFVFSQRGFPGNGGMTNKRGKSWSTDRESYPNIVYIAGTHIFCVGSPCFSTACASLSNSCVRTTYLLSSQTSRKTPFKYDEDHFCAEQQQE